MPILVLLVLKLLPRLSAKGGDVRDISQDYRRLFCWLSETVNKDIMMQKLPECPVSSAKPNLRKKVKVNGK